MFKQFNRNPKVQFAEGREMREQKQNLFTTKAGPNEVAVSYPNLYPILGESNPLCDVKYTGERTDADNIPVIASLYRDGPLYDTPDMLHMTLGAQYLGLNSVPDRTDLPDRPFPYNDQFAQIELEAIAAAYGTQLTELPFFNYDYQTSLPGLADDIPAFIGALVHYQSVEQDVAGLMGKYNTALSMTDYMISMGYNNEAAQTTELMGLLHKANMFNVFEQLGTVMSQEYLDIKWFKTTSVINTMPSRKSNSVVDALKTITVVHEIPDLVIKTKPDEEHPQGTVVWDFGKECNNIEVSMYYDDQVQTEHFSMHNLFYEISELLDPFRIIAWARQKYAGVEGIGTATQYANRIVACVSALVNALNNWRIAMNDLKTLLLVLQSNTGLNNWILGTEYVNPRRPRAQITKLGNFAIIRDIFVHIHTGGRGIVIDPNTKKWVASAIWHRYDGIPSFDLYEGGFILSTLDTYQAVPGEMTGQDTPYMMFPIVFKKYAGIHYYDYVGEAETPQYIGHGVVDVDGTVSEALFCTRLGYVSHIGTEAVGVANRPAFMARLFLTPMVSEEFTNIKAPYFWSSNIANDHNLISAISRFLVYEFGMSLGVNVTGGSILENSVLGTAGIDPNIMGIVTRQFSDFALNSIAFLKSNAPIRQSPDDVDIGFVFGR